MLIHKVLSALLLAGSVLASPVPADGVELDARDDGALHLPARDDTLHLQARDPPYARVRTPLKDAQGRQWWLAVSILSAFPLRNGVRVFLDPTGRRIYTGWAIRDGWKGQIKVASGSQNYCLDAGSSPRNGIELKVWECLDVPQQKWHVHDGRIELIGYGLCVDVKDGKVGGGGMVQTWQCYQGNKNQQWQLIGEDVVPRDVSLEEREATIEAQDVQHARDETPMLDGRNAGELNARTASMTPSLTARYTPPRIDGRRLRSILRDDTGDWRWLVVPRLFAYPIENGIPAGLDRTGRKIRASWGVRDGMKGNIQIHDDYINSNNKTYCLDAGSRPRNGVELKIWECLDVPQQKWHVHNGRIELIGYGLCADVKDGIKNGKFAGEVVQTWQCYEGNRNQQWEIVDMSLPPREVKERGVEVEERGVEVEQREASTDVSARDDAPGIEARDDTPAALAPRADRVVQRIKSALRDAKGDWRWLTVMRIFALPIENGIPGVLDMTGRKIRASWYIKDGQKGNIQVEDGYINSNNKTYCLDAGLNPHNGVQIKIWECLNVPQQKWHVHDGRIELIGYGLCLDVRDGNLGANSVVQTWQCYPGNRNQQWELVNFAPTRRGHEEREAEVIEGRNVD